MDMTQLQKWVESFRMKYESFLTGCDALEELGSWDKETLGEMEVFYANDMVSIILRLIVSDGVVTKKEVDYLNDFFGFQYTTQELTELYRLCKEDIGHAFDESFENGISYMRRINGKLADAYKELLVLMCKIIIECDGEVLSVEVAEVQRLMAMCAGR